ncbi:hypothetical protein TNCV_1822051 [Trichonephila clavipes]|nr:hypothetical protein TNCV_1822051 [Trichonephila clavipes]
MRTEEIYFLESKFLNDIDVSEKARKLTKTMDTLDLRKFSRSAGNIEKVFVSVPNYFISHKTVSSGGTAILLKSSLNYHHIPTPPLGKDESTIVVLTRPPRRGTTTSSVNLHFTLQPTAPTTWRNTSPSSTSPFYAEISTPTILTGAIFKTTPEGCISKT